MAEHSRCQPGRPAPRAVSQLGSPGLGAFPENEVAGVFLLVLVRVDPRAGEVVLRSNPRELAVAPERSRS